MDQHALQRYARLIVRTGANVQPGQKVIVSAQVDQLPLVTELVREAYAAGAALVEMKWQSDDIDRLHYQHAQPDLLAAVRPWEEARAKQEAEDLPVLIRLESSDPDSLCGIDPTLLARVGQQRTAVFKPYRDQMDGRHQWVIVSAPSAKWAKKVFPDLTEEAAVERLWEAIFSCVYLDHEDPEALWTEHTKTISEKARWLSEQQFVRLEYHSANGTNFSVGLIPGAKWAGAGDVNPVNGAFYVPNMPTEEVFTSPMAGVCEGTLVATRPLSWSGQLIDGFSVDFHDGKVVSCHARQGQDILERMFAMDEGAAMLGELALVPKHSPIQRSGVLFFNTLFDENASCHVAVGQGFGEVLENSLGLSREELRARGINDSIIHVDFMVGSDDLSVIGYRADGTAVPVFVDGSWAE